MYGVPVNESECCGGSLPGGCVLERILAVQQLDDMDIDGVFPLYTDIQHKMDAKKSG